MQTLYEAMREWQMQEKTAAHEVSLILLRRALWLLREPSVNKRCALSTVDVGRVTGLYGYLDLYALRAPRPLLYKSTT